MAGNSRTSNERESNLIKRVQELLFSEIVTLIVAWVLAILTNSIFLIGLTIFLQFILVISSPIIVWVILKRTRIQINYLFKVLVCLLIASALAALFSTLTYSQPLEVPQTGIALNETSYTGEYLRGESDCRQKPKPDQCLTQIRIQGEQVYLVPKPNQSSKELHVLLDINWSKWEKFPTLPRNYQGRVHYVMSFECNFSNGESSVTNISSPIRVQYSMAPKSIVLSYLIGFIEIPFLFPLDNTVPHNIIKETRKQAMTICV